MFGWRFRRLARGRRLRGRAGRVRAGLGAGRGAPPPRRTRRRWRGGYRCGTHEVAVERAKEPGGSQPAEDEAGASLLPELRLRALVMLRLTTSDRFLNAACATCAAVGSAPAGPASCLAGQPDRSAAPYRIVCLGQCRSRCGVTAPAKPVFSSRPLRSLRRGTSNGRRLPRAVRRQQGRPATVTKSPALPLHLISAPFCEADGSGADVEQPVMAGRAFPPPRQTRLAGR
jgi:hypothetical protein